jgi:RsiW-degrading membrane proteinase PrsW (M82 family)
MFFEVVMHEYFWLSFFPISFLGVGFWFLFIERERKKKDPLIIFFLALICGVISAFIFSLFEIFFLEKSLFIKVLGEEFIKCLFALLAMEMSKNRFETIAGGIVYGFSVGLGFALAENIIYLALQHDVSQFTADFWITFQGRFWSSTLLHGITMAVFGLFYAAAYLSPTLYKEKHKSPLRVFLKLPSLQQLKYILTFHISRRHLLFTQEIALEQHSSRSVLIEGFLVAVLLHFAFNLSLALSHIALAFGISLFMMLFLKNTIRTISKTKIPEKNIISCENNL